MEMVGTVVRRGKKPQKPVPIQQSSKKYNRFASEEVRPTP
jgi:hypothetical protein